MLSIHFVVFLVLPFDFLSSLFVVLNIRGSCRVLEWYFHTQIMPGKSGEKSGGWPEKIVGGPCMGGRPLLESMLSLNISIGISFEINKPESKYADNITKMEYTPYSRSAIKPLGKV